MDQDGALQTTRLSMRPCRRKKTLCQTLFVPFPVGSHRSSTIGNDAGLNLSHEFELGIRRIVGDHTPRFTFKFEERTTHDQNLKETISSRDSIIFEIGHR
jgi:hypothetical protein